MFWSEAKQWWILEDGYIVSYVDLTEIFHIL